MVGHHPPKPPEGARVVTASGRRGVVVDVYVRHPAPDVVWVAWDGAEAHPDNATPINVRYVRVVPT